MQVIGLLTSDFSVYHDMVAALREQGIPFVSIRDDEEIPLSVGAVVTTAAEASVIPHANVVVFSTPLETVDAARRALSSPARFRHLVVGIDPGERPGVAVMGDGRVLSTAQAASPEGVPDVVERAIASLEYERATIRIGHGSPTHRDRIVHGLLPLGLRIEIVDETRSTPGTYRTNAERDIVAAKSIALARGTAYATAAPPVIRPTVGEIRDLQRKSRIASSGAVTISRTLARAVAMGRLTLDEAVERQMHGRA